MDLSFPTVSVTHSGAPPKSLHRKEALRVPSAVAAGSPGSLPTSGSTLRRVSVCRQSGG
ncbi:hypothetical protein FRAHR75_130116 [Frankia sp. Hr75.2]|nr:hypothetical protein FRAHR75_130116 [Frankia sp. Hr75.2]